MRLDNTRGGASRSFSADVARFLERAGFLGQQLSREPDKASSDAIDMPEELRTAVAELHDANEALLISQERAAQAQQRYQELFDFAPDGYLVTDLQGVIHEANRMAAILLNVEQSHLLGKPLVVFVAMHDRAQFFSYFAALHEGEEFHDQEICLQPPEWAPTPAAFSVAPCRNVQGQVVGLRWLIRNIRERKQAEAALRASEARFRDLIEGSIQGVIVHSYFRPMFVNQAYAAIFGYTPSEILALECTEALIAPHERPRLRRYHEARLRGEIVPSHYEWQGRKKDGSLIWVETRVRTIEWGGHPAIQATVVDITQRKAAEAALSRAHEELEQRVQARTAELARVNEAMQAALKGKEALLKEVHHRVKNNFQVISSLLDLQVEAHPDPVVRVLLEESQSRIQAMALIHESLQHSDDVTHVNAVDYFERLSACIFQAADLWGQRLTLQLDIAPVLLPVQTAISCGLIINELLSNSLKHAFPNSLCGTVHVTMQQYASGICNLTVRDTGVGIPADVDVYASESLGLQLVCLLVKQLQGSIALERQGGTAFTVMFPA